MAKPKDDIEVWDGRLIAAARALIGMTSRELAKAAGVSTKTIVRIEGDDHVMISPTHRHGCTSRETWTKVLAAIEEKGVELVPAKSGKGPGVCRKV